MQALLFISGDMARAYIAQANNWVANCYAIQDPMFNDFFVAILAEYMANQNGYTLSEQVEMQTAIDENLVPMFNVRI